MNPESKRPIQVEDLLRLKRAERPPAEFWTEFDRQLRAKQLAALVAKRPWWHRVPTVFSGFGRFALPVGATAALALTFVALRETPPPSVASGEAVPAADLAGSAASRGVVVAATAVEADLRSTREHAVAASGQAIRGESATTTNASPQAATMLVALASEATLPGELSGMIPLLGTSGAESDSLVSDFASSTRFASDSSSASSTLDSMVGRGLLESAVGFASRSLAARPAVEPLQQITPPGGRIRSKMLTAMVSMHATETPARAHERVSSRIDEERLSDQIQRLGARGDRLIWRF